VSFKDAAARLSGKPDGRPARQRRHQPLVMKRRPRGLQSSATWDSAAYDVLAAATELYANRLLTDEPALAYTARRGFHRDILEQYRVGYASSDELVSYLRWRRLPIGAALRTGLLTRDGHEALAGRVTLVELRDGRPSWLIGRVLADPGCGRRNEGPSYLGLPGAKPLFGWEEALSDKRATVVVEGPLDWLTLRQWGVSGVALLGNRVSPQSVDALSQFARLYVALDPDDARRCRGSSAAGPFRRTRDPSCVARWPRHRRSGADPRRPGKVRRGRESGGGCMSSPTTNAESTSPAKPAGSRAGRAPTSSLSDGLGPTPRSVSQARTQAAVGRASGSRPSNLAAPMTSPTGTQ
jgi:Toprim-like